MMDEELSDALALVARSLHSIAETMAKEHALNRERFEKQYPVKGEPRDVTVTHIETEEERLRRDQGDNDETDEEWIGQRERAYTQAEEARRTRKAAGGSKKARS